MEHGSLQAQTRIEQVFNTAGRPGCLLHRVPRAAKAFLLGGYDPQLHQSKPTAVTSTSGHQRGPSEPARSTAAPRSPVALGFAPSSRKAQRREKTALNDNRQQMEAWRGGKAAKFCSHDRQKNIAAHTASSWLFLSGGTLQEFWLVL